MTRLCRFTALASRDLESILDYVAEHSNIDAADTVLRKINQKCNQLTQFPEMGRKRDELSAGVRSFSVDGYLVLYRIVQPDVEILRIVSGFRDLKSLFAE